MVISVTPIYHLVSLGEQFAVRTAREVSALDWCLGLLELPRKPSYQARGEDQRVTAGVPTPVEPAWQRRKAAGARAPSGQTDPSLYLPGKGGEGCYLSPPFPPLTLS